ncbi:hypothetical protein [Pigmentiphaga litoralis]|uniref:hypothetical protein n=1 Tax=Pigmentiphaga litoralis TaxID=516702 RepID=UPI003B428ED4
MTNQTAAGNTPVVDGTGVRFTLFHDTRGPVVVEIACSTLRRIFQARSDAPDDLLDAYVKHQAQIHQAATVKVPSNGMVLLADGDFASTARDRSAGVTS